MASCATPDVVLAYLFRRDELEFACRYVLAHPVSGVGAPDALAYAALFAKTLAIELPIYGIALRRRTLHGLVLNALTHPAVVFAFPPLFALGGTSYVACLVAAEAFAIVAEAGYLRALALPWTRAFLASVAANLASWWLGLTLLA